MTTQTLKITQLANAGVLSGTEVVPVVQGGITKQVTTQQIADLFTGAGSGTVTSVGLSAPSFLAVGGSPVTSSGTLTLSLATQSANQVFVGPATGPASAPTFRALVAADIPNGLPAGGTTGQVLAKASGTDYATGWISAPTGTVTSVDATVPASLLTVSGVPITTSGTIAIGLATQSANLVFAGPSSGVATAPTFRSIVNNDLPVVSVVKGGTGLSSYAVGDILYADSGTSLARLADIATGNALLSGGVGVAPTWGKVDVTTTITGTLPIANGGTGQTTAETAFNALAPTTTRGDLIFRNATTNTRLAASTSGYHLQTNGAGTDPTWTGFTQTGTGAVTRTWQSKATDVFHVADFGASTSESAANNATYVQAAIDAANASGGAFVRFAAGNYNINTITMKSGVILVGSGWGTTLTYSGSGTMFDASTSTILYRAGIETMQIDEGASCATVINLLSGYQCVFRNIRFLGTSATSVVFNLECNASGAFNPDGNRNVVFNYFDQILHDGSCGKLVRMYGLGTDGVAVTAPVTLNTFVGINARGIKVTGIEFARWCDSNYFAGITRLALTADYAVGVEHNSLNPTVNCGVYANNFDHLAVDTFGTMTGRVGLKMNNTKQNWCPVFYQYPLAEGGSFVSTAGTTCYYVAWVDELNNSFHVYSDNYFHDHIDILSGGNINFADDILITHAADQLTFTGAGAAGYAFDSLVTASRAGVPFLANNTNNAASNTGIILRSGRATSSTNDDIHLLFQLKDSGGNQTDYARIKGLIESNTDTTETGQLRFGVAVAGTVSDRMIMTATSLLPNSNDLLALGTASLSWSDLFLASGGVINWNNGTYTLTQSGSTLTSSGTIATADLTVTNTPRINVAASTIGTGVKVISNAADSSTNFGKYFALNLNGTTVFVPCGTVAPT